MSRLLKLLEPSTPFIAFNYFIYCDSMTKKTIIVSFILVLACGLVCVAQYTGSDLERKKAENLYPEPGPGDLLIVDQLKATNIQLQEQTRLLAEQNRILLDTLDQIRKQKSPQAGDEHKDQARLTNTSAIND